MKKKLVQEVLQQQQQQSHNKKKKKKTGGEEARPTLPQASEQLDTSSLSAAPTGKSMSHAARRRRSSLEGSEGAAPSPSTTPRGKGMTEAKLDVSSLFEEARRPKWQVRRSSLEGSEGSAAPSPLTTPRAKGLMDVRTPPSGGKIGALLPTTIRPTGSVHKRRLSFLQAKEEKEEKEGEGGEDTEMKENDSVPSPAAPSSTTTTPKLKKKKKSAVKESPGVSSSKMTPSELKTEKQKKKKRKSAEKGKSTPPSMREKRQLDSNGAAKGAKEEEKEGGDDEWPDMKAFVPAKTEDSAERKRVKVERNLKKKKEKPQPPQEDEEPKATVPQPDIVPTPRSNGTVAKPSPTTVHSHRPAPAHPTPQKKPIDNGRSPEAVGATPMMNGRVKRVSSPEVSTTSSDDDDIHLREDAARRKKLTKKPEVTPSKVSTPLSKMTTPTPKVPPVTPKSIEKSPKEETVTPSGKEKKKKKKRKSKVVEGKGKTGAEPAKELKEERLRPSSDLLQMVAARLANGHGLLIFRLISRETRRIAEHQLRQADDVLHLEEFDDENAFTRDDMTAWWEQRREEEDTSVGEGKENRSHAQISAYLKMRSVEKRLLKDMDGGLSHPSSAARAVDTVQLLQHPLETLDAACLLHESQTAAATRLLQQEGGRLGEVWLGHCDAKLVREMKRLTAIERFEHRQATMATLERLPLLQMTELRLDIVDDSATRAALADHLVNGKNLRALEMNVVPSGPLDGNTASQYTLFTRRSYDRADYTDDLEWMIPNIEDGEPDPVTLCMPELEHLATNVANVKLFWQLRDCSPLLRRLQSLRVGTLSRTRELIASSELFHDTKEARKYRQPGFFSLRDVYETELESVTLRLADRVGVARLQREAATMFEAIGELPPSLRRLSISLFYNQFAGVCAPFRKWAEPETAVDAPDTEHIHIEEMHLHFERAFDLRGLPVLLPLSINTLSITVNYDSEDDARCLGPFLDMIPGLARLENLEDLHIQVWGVRCLQPLVGAVAACSSLAARLTRLAVAAYPVEDAFFETSSASSWLHSSLSAFPRLRSLGLHAAVLVRMIPEERRSGYSWRNGLAWLANELLRGSEGLSDSAHSDQAPPLELIELAAAPGLPVLDDGEDYTITPHWEVEYIATELVLTPEDEEENQEIEDPSFSIPHGSSDEDDSFLTDGEEEDGMGDASRDALEKMEEGLEDETERIERREQRRDEKVRAAIERGDMPEGEEEEEGGLIDFDSISDEEEEETMPKSEFFDDEAVESDREESGDEEEGKQEESAESECSSEDEDEEREEERKKEEGRREKRRERKQAKLDNEVDKRNRKRALESDEDEEEEMVIRRGPINKKKRVIIESDEE